MRTVAEAIDGVRTRINDRDSSRPVFDDPVILTHLSDCYTRLAAKLPMRPTYMTKAAVGDTELVLTGTSVDGIGDVLYSDDKFTRNPLPKKSMDYIRSRMARLSVPELAPTCYAAEEGVSGITTLYFDATLPSGSTLYIGIKAQAVVLDSNDDLIPLEGDAWNTLLRTTAGSVLIAASEDALKKLNVSRDYGRMLFGSMAEGVDDERARVGSIGLVDRIVQTED